MSKCKEVVCRYCKQACWLLDSACKEGEGMMIPDIVYNQKTMEPDSVEAFFYRFLFLDMMSHEKKEQREGTPSIQTQEGNSNTELPERQFKPRALRCESPDNASFDLLEDICVRCGVSVYQAELRLAGGRSYHTLCYTCFSCHRFLDAMIVTDGPDSEAYCKTCYKYKFMNDVNRPLGAGRTDSIMAKEGDSDRCLRCSGRVFQAEQRLSAYGVYHKACFRCSEPSCGRTLDSASYCDSSAGLIYCKTCYARQYGTRGFGYGATPTLVSPVDSQEETPASRTPTPASGAATSSSTRWGVSTLPPPAKKTPAAAFKPTPLAKCRRCAKDVFALERVFVGKYQWHRACLNCATCSRRLDSATLNDVSEGGNVYCPKCYANGYTLSRAAERKVKEASVPDDKDEPEYTSL